ncbi:MAG: hypothetical protein K2N17_00560, partial [Clostridia bacterium]|nr:hypothetical protein [Clostridia bacterium]
YIKCPRCELNFIIEGQQEYCDVCIAEMKGNKLEFADLEDEELEAELENESMELCPVCGINNMRFGESMCEACKKQSEYEEDIVEDDEQDEEWKSYLTEDTEDLSLDEEELAEELAEVGEEEEENAEEEDDFFDDDIDSLDDLDDDEDDDDDDEDDDDDLF